MVIFQYNLYIFGIHLWTVLYTKPCYNEPCYKEVVVYLLTKYLVPENCACILYLKRDFTFKDGKLKFDRYFINCKPLLGSHTLPSLPCYLLILQTFVMQLAMWTHGPVAIALKPDLDADLAMSSLCDPKSGLQLIKYRSNFNFPSLKVSLV